MARPIGRNVLALDIGKASHWAVMATRSDEVLANRPVSNRERDLDELFASAPEGALVVVDQKRNIGSLALQHARKAAQRGHMVSCATRDKNRLRSILLESCPAFEALAEEATYGCLLTVPDVGPARRPSSSSPSTSRTFPPTLPSSGISGSQCFYSCATMLVGGNGTVCASNKTAYTYFRIDTASTPGYITIA